MNTLISGATMWSVFHGTANRLALKLDKKKATIVCMWAKAKCNVLCCRVCRRQFRLVRKQYPELEPTVEAFRSRKSACRLIREWHRIVNIRLKVEEVDGGFKTDEDYLAWYQQNVSIWDYLTDIWDDLFCIFLCLPNHFSCDLIRRCKRIDLYIQYLIQVFAILSEAAEDKKDADVLQQHATVFGNIFGHKEDQNPRFTTAEQFVFKLVKCLSKIPYICPPWLKMLGKTKYLKYINAQSCLYAFIIRYVPAIATRAEIVRGPKTGQVPDENNSEELNPTGCR